MSFSRKRPHAGIRCPGHDYSDRCIYHIVLNKNENIPDFSVVTGFIGNHDYPPAIRLSETGIIIAKCLSTIKGRFPFVSILRRSIMPDHVPPFIRPEEEKARDWAILNGGVIIYITYKPFPDRFKPSGRMFDLCAEGRLLIVAITLGTDEQAYLDRKGKPSAFTCRRMNDLAIEISTQEFKLG